MKLLVFVSSHCPHCPNAEKVAEKIAPEYSDNGLSFRKVRMKTSEGKELASKYNIMAVPTTLLLDNEDNEIQRLVGVPDEASLRSKIEKSLGMKGSFFKRIFG
ncbi:MAG: thioredoxin family protein [Candidatus Aenigmarchaeota archaeon]|nr:thioredoxin family protein [Candidatus Aenigmarchaeota archaeon]